MKKVLFLDFDGVLNSHAWIKTDRRNDPLAPDRGLDPAAVALVSEICERTGALVVISSTWRLFNEDCAELLKRRGFTGEVVGMTPDLNTRTRALWTSVERGVEIQAWLDANGGADVIAILDDDADMAHLGPRLVQTGFARGLERHHVELVVAMLGER